MADSVTAADVLTGLDEARVVAATERTFIAHTIACVRAAGGQVSVDDQMTQVATEIGLAVFNGVLATSLTAASADETIAATLSAFRTRGRPMFWWVTPSSSPPDLGRRLVARGLTPAGSDVGMARDLATPEESPPVAVAVERVRDEATMEMWLQTFGAGFGVAAARLTEYGRMVHGAPPDRHPAGRFYLARLDGAPVGTAGLFCAAGVANVVQVCTVPAARRQGVGAALTRATLADARGFGYRVAVLRASEEGVPLYRRLGFAPYCRLDAYRWPAPGA